MIRHPFLVAFQLACAGGIATAAHHAFAAERARAEAPLGFSLAVLGESETPDGAWEGVDLLATPRKRAERVQLTLRPSQAARVTLDLVEDGEVRRIYPALGQSPLLAAGRSYALPAPSSFYEVDGDAHLRLTVAPAGLGESRGHPALAAPTGSTRRVRYPLSDGAKFDVAQWQFETKGAGVVDLEARR